MDRGQEMKETKNVNGYEVCINFDMTTYFCILDKSSRTCDGICIFVEGALQAVPIFPERE